MQIEGDKPRWWRPGMRYRDPRPTGINRQQKRAAQRSTPRLIEWRFQVTLPFGSETKSAYGYTWPELKADRERIEQRTKVAPEDIRFSELVSRWLEYRHTKGHSDRRIRDTQSRLAKFILPTFGRRTLADLCLHYPVIEEHFERLAETHPNSCALQLAYDEFGRVFTFAVRKRWCTFNPITNLKGCRPTYKAAAKQPFTLDELLTLLTLASGQTRVMILFLVCTACRPQELFGLRVSDVDLLHREVTFANFATRDLHGKIVERNIGKNEKSCRTTPLIAELVSVLTEYLATAGLGQDDPLFPNHKGRIRADSYWRDFIFKPLCEKIGRADATTNYLRHSANSLLAELGVSAEHRALVCGHSEAVNKAVYTHLSLQAKRRALDKLAGLFPRTGRLGTGLGSELVNAPEPPSERPLLAI
jgi:integrase